MACSKSSKSVIDYIIYLCGFPDDSNMVKLIRNKGWIDLSDVTMLSLDDTNDFEMVNYKDQPMAHHARRFRGFLLYYRRKSRELSSKLDKDDVMMMTRTEFTNYCGSLDYHTDMHLSGYKKRAPQVVIDDELTDIKFIPTAPKLVVVDDEIMAPFAGEHSSKHIVDKVITQSYSDITTLDNDDSQLYHPNVVDLWGVDVGNDYHKDKTKKKGYITLIGIPDPTSIRLITSPSFMVSRKLITSVNGELWKSSSVIGMMGRIMK
jgi:hypothetical protein